MDVRLRPTVEADRDVLFAQQNDPEANAMAMFPAREAEAFDEHLRAVLADPANRKYTIEVDGEIAGDIGSWSSEGHREVGYWIGRPFWGRGVATAALTAFLQIERERPLQAFVAVGNAASRRVAEHCGFVWAREEEAEGVLYAVYELP